MSSLNALEKFLKENTGFYHAHTAAILSWFSEKYDGKKNVKIPIDKHYNIIINEGCISIYPPTYDAYGERMEMKNYARSSLEAYSANYCKICRDERREFWEVHREIIGRLPRDVGKFVMNLPMTVGRYWRIIVLTNRFIRKWDNDQWDINNLKPVNIDKILKILREEYDLVVPKWSGKCPEVYRRFADVCVEFAAEEAREDEKKADYSRHSTQ